LNSLDIPIFFYIHPFFKPKGEIPSSADTDWSGFSLGIYTWTIQTFLRLKEAGVQCELTYELPDEGIVFAHRKCLSSVDNLYKEKIKPSRSRFIVDITADFNMYSHANMHIIQNKKQALASPYYEFITHWTQPNIKVRDKKRGSLIKNVAYYGNIRNIPKELKNPQWSIELDRLDCHWISKYQEFKWENIQTYQMDTGWSSYTDVDLIVAIRSFSKRTCQFDNKPATKLYNGWLAGVPCILGKESSLIFERKSKLDYIEVTNYHETLSAVKLLKKNPSLYSDMVANGLERSKEISPKATTKNWCLLIENVIIPSYQKWLNSSEIEKTTSIAIQKLFNFNYHVNHRIMHSILRK